MLYHKDCSGPLLAKVDRVISIFANVSVSTTSLNVSGLNIVKRGDEQTGIKFYCPDCDKDDIELSDDTAYFQCARCGNSYKISDGRIAKESGGLFCQSCINRLFKDKEEVVLFTNVINKVVLK